MKPNVPACLAFLAVALWSPTTFAAEDSRAQLLAEAEFTIARDEVIREVLSGCLIEISSNDPEATPERIRDITFRMLNAGGEKIEERIAELTRAVMPLDPDERHTVYTAERLKCAEDFITGAIELFDIWEEHLRELQTR